MILHIKGCINLWTKLLPIHSKHHHYKGGLVKPTFCDFRVKKSPIVHASKHRCYAIFFRDYFQYITYALLLVKQCGLAVTQLRLDYLFLSLLYEMYGYFLNWANKALNHVYSSLVRLMRNRYEMQNSMATSRYIK